MHTPSERLGGCADETDRKAVENEIYATMMVQARMGKHKAVHRLPEPTHSPEPYIRGPPRTVTAGNGVLFVEEVTNLC